MTYLHDDLLEQATHLAERHSKKPGQASLRRSVSACYYALFHLLIHEAAKRAFPGDDSILLRNYLSRTISHAHVKHVSQQFSYKKPISKALGSALKTEILDEKLVLIATTFLRLYNNRNDADYNVSKKFNKKYALDLINVTKEAFENWKDVRKTAQGSLFLFMINYNKFL